MSFRALLKSFLLFSVLVGLCHPVFGLPAFATAQPVEEQATLQRFRSRLLTDYPPTACTAKALLGEEYEHVVHAGAEDLSACGCPLLGAAEGGEGIAMVRCTPKTRAFTVAWFGSSNAAVIGRYEGRGKLKLWTSDSQFKRKPPAIVGAALECLKRFPEPSKTALFPHDEWILPGRRHRLPAECRDNRMIAKKKTEFLEREKAASCLVRDGKHLPLGWPHVLFSGCEAGTPLLEQPEPKAPRIDALRCGSIVFPAEREFEIQPEGGFLCVYTKRNGKALTGWIPQNAVVTLEQIGEERSILFPEESNPPLERWEGTWKPLRLPEAVKPARNFLAKGQLVVRREENGLRFRLASLECEEKPLNLPLVPGGSFAEYQERDRRATAVLGPNGLLFLELDGFCRGKHYLNIFERMSDPP